VNRSATFFEQELRNNEHRSSRSKSSSVVISCRGRIRSRRDLQAFRIGYARRPGMVWRRSQGPGRFSGGRRDGRSPRAAHERVWLLRSLSHRLMFAVVDAQGRVVAFSGRALRELPPEARTEPRAASFVSRLRATAEIDAHKRRSTSTRQRARSTRRARCSSHSPSAHSIRQSEVAVLVEGNFDVVSCTRAASRTSSRRSVRRSRPSKPSC